MFGNSKGQVSQLLPEDYLKRLLEQRRLNTRDECHGEYR